MNDLKFVYVTYIETTPQTLWRALTDGEVTEQYWGGGRIESAWEAGARVRHSKHDHGLDWEGEVLEHDPHRCLSYTMSSGSDDARSRVTFSLEPHEGIVKLTLVHDQLDAKGLRGISFGWPAILSSLKSLCERGDALAYSRWW